MNKFWIPCMLAAALAFPVWGQKVKVEKPDRDKIIHVQTALDHLTVLEMGQPVDTVAVGSPVFRVEWRGSKVFIEPTEPDMATNLFVWTAAGRFNYELDPAGVVPQMVFAIDQPTGDPPKAAAPAPRTRDSADSLLAEVLITARPIQLLGRISGKDRVAFYLTDLLERDGKVFIRYTIRNGTKKAYVPGSPQVWALDTPRYRESLYTLSNYQLSPDQAAKLKCKGEIALEIAQSELRSQRVEPGQETTGIVAINLALSTNDPKVLRVSFLPGPKGPIAATLVL